MLVVFSMVWLLDMRALNLGAWGGPWGWASKSTFAKEGKCGWKKKAVAFAKVDNYVCIRRHLRL